MLCTAAAASGCYESGRKRVADTNTNWLDVCRTSADCAEGMRCLEAVCTVACEGTATCALLSTQARCLPMSEPGPVARICDVSCTGDEGCLELDEAFRCVEGRCRADDDTTFEPPALDAEVDESFVEPPDASAPSPQQLVTFDLEGPLLLSAADRQASAPRVRWFENHWAVAWMSSDLPDLVITPYDDGGALSVVEMSGFAIDAQYQVPTLPEGRLNRRVADINAQGEALNWRGGNCLLRMTSWRTQEVRDLYACFDGTSAAVSVDGRDWLIATTSFSGAFAGTFGFEAGLNSPLSLVHESPGGVLLGGFSHHRHGATLLWGSPTGVTIARIDDIATMDAVKTTRLEMPPGVQSPVFSLPSASHAVGAFGAEPIVVSLADGALWSQVIDGQSVWSIRRITDTGTAEGVIGISGMPEHDLAAVCYVTSSRRADRTLPPVEGVSIVLLDRNGQAVQEPISIANDFAIGGGCDLAWSGSSLLVAWWETPSADAKHSLIQAMRLTPRW